MKSKNFKDEIYIAKVTALYCTRQELSEWTKKRGFSLGDFNDFDGLHFLDENRDNVIWMLKPKDFYALLHECVHLVRSIFENRGIDCNLKNEDEHFAYYQNYWFKNLWRFFGNINKEK